MTVVAWEPLPHAAPTLLNSGNFGVERQRWAPDTAPACANADSPRHRGGDERVEVAVGGRLHLERLVSDVEQRFVVEDPGAEVGGRGGGLCGW